MKNEIVKRALDAGILLTPALLETTDEKKLNDMINEAKGKKPILTERGVPSKSRIVLKVTRIQPKQKLTPDDFTRYYNNKYEGIKKILLKKLDAVSINKIEKSYSEVSVIGMVREPAVNGFVLEDPTGEIDVVSNNEIGVDDVIGVKGNVREGKLIEKEIVLPDVPLENVPKKLQNTSILLTTSLTDKTKPLVQAANFVLVPKSGDELNEKEKDKMITDFTNPTTITISSQGTEFRVLVYNPGTDIDEKQALDYLRKRHLSPDRNMIIGIEDCFLMEPIPDIFWIISKNRFIGNYKGVTIISCEAPDAAMINLETREVEFKQV